jgi:hypothetical protein
MFGERGFFVTLAIILSWASGFPLAARAAQNEPVSSEVLVDLHHDPAVIANRFISIEMSMRDRRVRTISVINRRTGAVSALEGEDFILEFADGRRLSSPEFELTRTAQEAGDGAARRLVVELRHKELVVRVKTELRPSEWWATRWVEVEGGSGRLSRVHLANWEAAEVRGPLEPGNVVETLGYPQGCGQPVYVKDLFLGIAHPGADNLAARGRASCSLPAYQELAARETVRTATLLIGAGEAGGARHAFLGCLLQRRTNPWRMIILVNDWYWKEKSQPLAALRALASIKQETSLPVDSFTLDDGWDFDWDQESGIWGRLNRHRFPQGWNALQMAGRVADIQVSLWFGPIGGYDQREKRVEFGRGMGFEINGDKLCLAGTRYKKHVTESFSDWARRGMDYIKVDGFWPDCRQTNHGHPVGPGGAVAQMDALIEVFATWRQARPDLVIGYTTGSNPSPFWLEHADFVWRGGVDDSHAGAGEPFDQHTTYLDSCLQAHREAQMPIGGFVTFDIVQHRIGGNSDRVFERGFWWLAARTSLHHDWYIQADDLTLERWKMLERAARWAREHEDVFRFGRMIGGDPARGEIYGFAAYDRGHGTLALRNPSGQPKGFDGNLAEILDLPKKDAGETYVLSSVFGLTRAIEGPRRAVDPMHLDLPPFEIAIVEVTRKPADAR